MSKSFKRKFKRVVVSAALGYTIGAGIGLAMGCGINTAGTTMAISSVKSTLDHGANTTMIGYNSNIHKEINQMMNQGVGVKKEYKIDLAVLRPPPDKTWNGLTADFPVDCTGNLYSQRLTKADAICRKFHLQEDRPGGPLLGYHSDSFSYNSAAQIQVARFFENHAHDIFVNFCPNHPVNYWQTFQLIRIMNPHVAQNYIHKRSLAADKYSSLWHKLDAQIYTNFSNNLSGWYQRMLPQLPTVVDDSLDTLKGYSNHAMILNLVSKVCQGRIPEAVNDAGWWALTETILVGILRLGSTAAGVVTGLLESAPAY